MTTEGALDNVVQGAFCVPRQVASAPVNPAPHDKPDPRCSLLCDESSHISSCRIRRALPVRPQSHRLVISVQIPALPPASTAQPWTPSSQATGQVFSHRPATTIQLGISMDKKLFIGATLVTATVIGGLVYYRHIKRREREPDEIVQVDIGGVPHNVPQSVLNKIEEALVHPEVAVARAVLSRENQAIRNQLIREAERLEREGQ